MATLLILFSLCHKSLYAIQVLLWGIPGFLNISCQDAWGHSANHEGCKWAVCHLVFLLDVCSACAPPPLQLAFLGISSSGFGSLHRRVFCWSVSSHPWQRKADSTVSTSGWTQNSWSFWSSQSWLIWQTSWVPWSLELILPWHNPISGHSEDLEHCISPSLSTDVYIAICAPHHWPSCSWLWTFWIWCLDIEFPSPSRWVSWLPSQNKARQGASPP